MKVTIDVPNKHREKLANALGIATANQTVDVINLEIGKFFSDYIYKAIRGQVEIEEVAKVKAIIDNAIKPEDIIPE